MRILITGASGLVGSRLIPALAAEGHLTTRLVRAGPRDATEYHWSPAAGVIDPAALAGCEAVVHLAGESIAGGRWSAGRKARMRDSRIGGTRLLCAAIARTVPSPRVLVCASAVGYYGDRGDEVLTDESAPGSGFLADLAQEWEGAARLAAGAGVRVVHLRFGLVLDRDRGALPIMALAFRAGLGGWLGNGRQWMSWIALDDLIAVIRHALASHDLAGPVNAVAPVPVTNRDFSRVLGRVVGRPVWIPAPELMLRLGLGEMGRELLLSSQRAVPSRLQARGFAFQHPELEGAMRQVLQAGAGPLDDATTPP